MTDRPTGKTLRLLEHLEDARGDLEASIALVRKSTSNQSRLATATADQLWRNAYTLRALLLAGTSKRPA